MCSVRLLWQPAVKYAGAGMTAYSRLSCRFRCAHTRKLRTRSAGFETVDNV